MFDLPETKRYHPPPHPHPLRTRLYSPYPTLTDSFNYVISIRRCNLRSPSPDPHSHPHSAARAQISDTNTRLRLQSKLDAYLAPDYTPTLATITTPSHDASLTSFEFPLFTNSTAHISLRTPTPPLSAESRYLATYAAAAAAQARPHSYYFYTRTASAQAQLEAAAVSGAQVLHEACRDKWLGSTFSWRLIHVPPPAQPSRAPLTGSKSRRKCKPGKKRRIKVRIVAAQKKREREERERVEVEKRSSENKARSEKRALRNRDKKAKKRAREKVRKVAASSAIAVGVEGGAG